MSEIWVLGIGVAAAAGGAAISANQQKKGAQGAAAAIARNQVAPPNFNDAYKSGVANQFQWTPWFAQQEMDLRKKYAPQQADLAASTYESLLPRIAATNMRALGRVDPESITGRKQLYDTVSGELGRGREISPEMLALTEQDIRKAQTARGNFLGNAPISAEASFTAREREGEFQQRIANMMNFLRGPTPEDHFGQLAGAGGPAIAGTLAGATSPGYNYVQPPTNVGEQFANNRYRTWAAQSGNGTQLGNAQAAVAMAPNPWAAALSAGLGAVSGAAGGGAIGGMGSGGAGAGQPAMQGAYVPKAVDSGWQYNSNQGWYR